MRYVVILAVLLGLVTFSTSNSFATSGPANSPSSDPIYMNYGGLKGEVTASDHQNWIELSSFQFGVGRGISSPTGSSADRQSSVPSVSEIKITKTTDSTSPTLLQEALGGQGQSVTIDFCKTDKDTCVTYMEYTLQNTMISGYSISSGGDRPTESITLNFTKIVFTYTPTNPDGSQGTPIEAGWDLATNTKV
jgi:type VI secretion system secreted protein Hcp